MRQPFPGNRIPADRISPISQKILALLPNPSSSALFNNYTSIGRGATDSNQFNIKLDHSFSEVNRLSGYYYQDALDALEPELIPGPATSARGSGSRNFWTRISHDYVFSPTVLNHVNLGFTRFKTTIESYSVDQNWPTQLGLTGVNTGPNNSFPCVDFVSSGYKSLGDSNCNSRTLQTNNSFQVIDSFSVIRGTHSFKFGGDFRLMETNGIDIYQSMACSNSMRLRPGFLAIQTPATQSPASCWARLTAGHFAISPTIRATGISIMRCMRKTTGR